MPDIPQLAYPVRVIGGQFATTEQGSPEDAISQIHLLCLTPPGWFAHAPAMGLTDQAHRAGSADIGEIERQIAEHVPDADAAVEADASRLNEALSAVGVRVGAGADS